MLNVMNQRIHPRSFHVLVCRQIERCLEQRMWIACLAPTAPQVVHQWIYIFFPQRRGLLHIPFAGEKRMGITALFSSPDDIVIQGIPPTSGDIRIPLEIEARVKKAREKNCTVLEGSLRIPEQTNRQQRPEKPNKSTLKSSRPWPAFRRSSHGRGHPPRDRADELVSEIFLPQKISS